jgi:hypothetical protein
MGIVRFALRFPHTFYVVAALILFLGSVQAGKLAHKDSCLQSTLSRPRKTKGAMKFIWQRSRTLAIAAVAMAAAGAAVAVGRPHAVSEPLLGPEWQCSRTAFLVTTCSRNPVREPGSVPPLSVRHLFGVLRNAAAE